MAIRKAESWRLCDAVVKKIEFGGCGKDDVREG